MARILVISDGLSDVESARVSAEKCYNGGVYIDVVLIDSSPQGEQMANTIALGGRVTAVTSKAQLESALTTEREDYEKDISKIPPTARPIIDFYNIQAFVLIVSGVFALLNVISFERRMFQISSLLSIVLILMGGVLIYFALEKKEQVPLYVHRQPTRIVSVPKRMGIQKNLLLISGAMAILLGAVLIIAGFFVAPGSPLMPVSNTATPTITQTPTETSTLTPTLTVTATNTPTLSVTATSTVSPTTTFTPTLTTTPTSQIKP